MSKQRLAAQGQGADHLPNIINPQTNPALECVVKSEVVHVNRKRFTLTLKTNHHGPFVRISEEAGCHHNTAIVPAEGIPDLVRVLSEMFCLSRNALPGQQPRRES
jgi:hypothetical protein